MMADADYERKIYNLLGLGFDAVDMDDTVKAVKQAILENRKLFLSTPNLNFLVAAQSNDAFRDSVINSDLSIADGMPIVLMCRLLDIPIRERVAGSSLIEVLGCDEECMRNPIKVFFFGGEDGIAEKAHNNLNNADCGLVSVGFLNPGFGTVEEMSKDRIIEQINDTGAEFVVVSLGAGKGQAWIEANRHKLNANIISHLGAVVNFIAGNVKRAPAWVQKLHMEWLWRIKEEPALFKRYWHDGLCFIKLMFKNVLPYAWAIRNGKNYSSPSIRIDSDQNTVVLTGSLTNNIRDDLGAVFDKFTTLNCDFTVDLKNATYIDQSVMGLFLIVRKKMTENKHHLSIIGVNGTVGEIVKLNKLGFMFGVE